MQANEVCSLSEWQSCLESPCTTPPEGSSAIPTLEFCGRYVLQNLFFIIHFSEEKQIDQPYMKLAHIHRDVTFFHSLPECILTCSSSLQTQIHTKQPYTENTLFPRTIPALLLALTLPFRQGLSCV